MTKKKAPEVYTPSASSLRIRRDYPLWYIPVLTAVLFFFYAFLSDTGMEGAVTAKIMTVCVCIGIVFLMFRKTLVERLVGRISLPVLAISGYVLICGISTFYALSGKFAIKEFVIMLCSFGLFLLILMNANATELSVRKIGSVVASALAVYSLISIDAASLGWLTTVFRAVLSPFTSVFQGSGGYEVGVRITGIFGNPNVYAGTTALGILLSLYLVQEAPNLRSKMYHLVLLSINALGFLLAFSMGGTAMFAVSVAVYLIAAGKGKRIPAFVLMLETAVLTLISTMIAFNGLGKEGFLGVLPLLAVLVNAGFLILVNRFVSDKLILLLQNKGKLSAIAIGALVALLLGYVVLGLLLTGSYTFSPGEKLRRSAYPSGGGYSLAVTTDADMNVMIESQNDAQTQQHKSTVLYNGPANQAGFTVPDDSKVVYFNFTAPNGGVLKEASFTDSNSKVETLPLKYLLFPEFIANRLQGLWANENAIQRLVFFKDGMRVFAQSPVIGNGVGSFENALFSVQDFYYTTKYVHNHYIQSLADTGLIGFVFFTGSLVLLGITLFRNRKTDRACFPALCACLAMIAGHSIVEVSFSTEVFQPTAFLIFALIAVNFATPIPKKALGQGLRFGSAAFAGVFAVLLSGNLFAKVILSEASFDNLEAAASIDFYEKNDSKLSYVIYSPQVDDTHVRRQAALYAEDLRKVKSNSIASRLVQYYIDVGQYDEMFECMAEGLSYTKSFAESWYNQLINLDFAFSKDYNPTYDVLMKDREKNVERALTVYDALLEHNRTQPEQILLQPRNMVTIGRLLAVKNLTDQAAVDTLLKTQLFALDSFADADLNGIPDAVTAEAGTVSMENGILHVTAGTSLLLNTFHDFEGAYQLTLNSTVPPTAGTVQDQPLTFTATDDGKQTAVVTLSENVDLNNTVIRLQFDQDAAISQLNFSLIPAAEPTT